jgi:hypothetical protein
MPILEVLLGIDPHLPVRSAQGVGSKLNAILERVAASPTYIAHDSVN